MIVATSTLELGIDVGDLDYVIQIDLQHSLFLFQRMGRQAGAPGVDATVCSWTTSDEGVSARLRDHAVAPKYVERITPPPLPGT